MTQVTITKESAGVTFAANRPNELSVISRIRNPSSLAKIISSEDIFKLFLIRQERFASNGAATTFTISNPPIIPDSQNVFVSGEFRAEGTGSLNYGIVDTTGVITFVTAPTLGAVRMPATLPANGMSLTTQPVLDDGVFPRLVLTTNASCVAGFVDITGVNDATGAVVTERIITAAGAQVIVATTHFRTVNAAGINAASITAAGATLTIHQSRPIRVDYRFTSGTVEVVVADVLENVRQPILECRVADFDRDQVSAVLQRKFGVDWVVHPFYKILIQLNSPAVIDTGLSSFEFSVESISTTPTEALAIYPEFSLGNIPLLE